MWYVSKKGENKVSEKTSLNYRKNKKGGRVSLPSEYFGKDSGRYFESDNAVTDSLNNEARSELKLKQAGGRVSLPSEYFGKDSGRYFDNVDAIDMSKTTSEFARPEMPFRLSTQNTLLEQGSPVEGSATTQSGGSTKNKNLCCYSTFEKMLKKNKLSLPFTQKAKKNLYKIILGSLNKKMNKCQKGVKNGKLSVKNMNNLLK